MKRQFIVTVDGGSMERLMDFVSADVIELWVQSHVPQTTVSVEELHVEAEMRGREG